MLCQTPNLPLAISWAMKWSFKVISKETFPLKIIKILVGNMSKQKIVSDENVCTVWIRRRKMCALLLLLFHSLSCPALWDSMDCTMSRFPVLHCLLEFAWIHVHWVGHAIEPFHPPLPSCPLAFNLSQNQGLFQWVSSSYQVAKVLDLQLQHQSFQWIFRVDFL